MIVAGKDCSIYFSTDGGDSFQRLGREPVHYNNPDRLAPLETPIVILVDDEEFEATRTKFIDDRGFMEYRLASGELMTGRYMWRYV